MRRTNTSVYGSRTGSVSPPERRTGTLVHQSSVKPARSDVSVSSSLPPLTPPPRVSSDSPPSSAERVESQWFGPTNPRMMPIGAELQGRRGWTPPPPSKGLAFAGVSVLLIGIAVAGTVFFLSPDGSKHTPPPVSTTTVTNADVPSTADTTAQAAPETTPETASAPPAKTITPNDLPTAAPVVKAVKAAPATARPVAPKPAIPAHAEKAPDATAATTKAPRTTKAAEPARDTSLPDLDRAAAAAGMKPAADDSSSTAGSATTPSQAEEGNKEEQRPIAPTTPAPSEALPDLQIQR